MFFRQTLDKYFRLVDKRPFFTQVAVSTTIAIVGDVACQVLLGNPKPSPTTTSEGHGDIAQSSPLSVAGTISSDAELARFPELRNQGPPSLPPPLSHKSQRNVDAVIDIERTQRFGLVRFAQFCLMVPWLSLLERVRFVGAVGVVSKVALDQLVWTPPSMCVFFTAMAMLEGESFQDGVDRAKAMLWPVLRINWPFWSSTWMLFGFEAGGIYLWRAMCGIDH